MSSEEFIRSTIKQFFGLNRTDAQMLVNLSEDNIARQWLEPDTDSVEHFLYINADLGLMSDWIGIYKTFNQAMRRTNADSLFNLKLFLSKLESDQIYASIQANHQDEISKWNSRFRES